MAEYIIKNGFVVDPTQGINCEKMDVAVKDGKIVDASEVMGAKVIDASGKLVMAGAVDVHSHSAGPKVNVGRNLRPEEKLNCYNPAKGAKRMEAGFSVPTAISSGYIFSRMGYGFAMEAAMPPLYARHTHEEMRDTPIVDEAALPVFGNNWFVMEYLKNNEIENTASYISWLLKVTKGYGIKCVNPGGSEAWGWGMNCLTIDDPVPFFDVTPKQIITGLIEANEYLRLPHSMHLHTNSLGEPGNYQITIDSLKCAEGIKADNDFGREQVLHHTHLQFHSYGGDSYSSKSFESRSKEVMDYFNSTDNLTFDIGQVTLDETTTMTADGPFEYHLSHMNNLKWVNKDVELETCAGVVPFIYNPNSFIGVAQWAIGLELALQCKDMTKCYLTSDAPNAGPLCRYPRVMKWLMSLKSRDEILDACKYGESVRRQCYIGEFDRELTLYELAQMNRQGAARMLGLSNMFGSLKPGMEGDVVVYPLNPESDLDDGEKIEHAFGNAEYFIKKGELIINDSEIISNGSKRTFWVNAGKELTPQVERDVSERFKKYYTVTRNNYEVKEHHYVPNEYMIEVNAA
ncbi:formylmethanofuran dehydrogenase subunit A [Methanoplanus endosymbiosus]|uniref:Formylmethanofuran dehydrogenase subunit A n=1 Tax=Methanoplanus endosymbiosus TaxID=33865 RepID=A0A9E7PMU6_9EURY|nr:formylmethanofuran dehydrogenase subunit A [Methanoplanus endosymbiosus]UUX91566.1 formylmethanofuran dehydrogenase subunit A [Methanoplanus endosymbiosus]